MEFTNTITINRRPAEVFEFLAHFENLPLWNYAISETRKVSNGSVGVGSRFRQTRRLPIRSEETFEVTEFEPDHRLSIRGPLGPFHAEVAYVVDPVVHGTALTNTMHLRPSGPLRLVAPLAASGVRSAVAANLETLKRILERSAKHPPTGRLDPGDAGLPTASSARPVGPDGRSCRSCLSTGPT